MLACLNLLRMHAVYIIRHQAFGNQLARHACINWRLPYLFAIRDPAITNGCVTYVPVCASRIHGRFSPTSLRLRFVSKQPFMKLISHVPHCM